MPSRRHKSSPSTPSSSAPAGTGAAPVRDPAEMFAAALKESDSRDRAKREKARQEQEAAAARQAAARAQADALEAARRDLDRAIQAVRDAKRNGKSTVEADAVWKSAKARVIELETGAAPTWAPVAASPDPDGAAEDAEDAPVEDDQVGDAQD